MFICHFLIDLTLAAPPKPFEILDGRFLRGEPLHQVEQAHGVGDSLLCWHGNILENMAKEEQNQSYLSTLVPFEAVALWPK